MSLRDEIARILAAEVNYPPLKTESLSRVLHAIGFTPEPTIGEIESALAALMAAGQVEAVHSARLGPRYRIMRQA